VGGSNENPINHKKHTDLAMPHCQHLTIVLASPTYIVPTTDVGTSLSVIYVFIYVFIFKKYKRVDNLKFKFSRISRLEK
jgi:hypothetical protein